MQQTQQKVPEKKSNLWLVIVFVIILLALLWPILRKGKAPADLSDLSDETATTSDDFLDFDGLNDASVLPPATIPPASPIRVQVTPSSSAVSASVIPLKVFFGFGNQVRQPETAQCSLVFSATRNVPATTAIARAALTELIKGPSALELKTGFFTLVNSKTMIKELTINNGVARVNLSADLIADTETEATCLEDGIRAQITETLKQFPTVRSVVILVNGVNF